MWIHSAKGGSFCYLFFFSFLAFAADREEKETKKLATSSAIRQFGLVDLVAYVITGHYPSQRYNGAGLTNFAHHHLRPEHTPIFTSNLQPRPSSPSLAALSPVPKWPYSSRRFCQVVARFVCPRPATADAAPCFSSRDRSPVATVRERHAQFRPVPRRQDELAVDLNLVLAPAPVLAADASTDSHQPVSLWPPVCQLYAH